MLHVVAPAGKLGVIVETPEGGEIKDTCQIVGGIRLVDRIVDVEDEDVRGMSAAGVSRTLRTSPSPRESWASS